MPEKKKLNNPSILNKYKKTTYSIGSLMLILAFLFIFRSWFRITIIPKTVGLFYSSSLQSTYTIELNALKNPYSALGYKELSKTPTTCLLQQAQSFHTEVDCSVNLLSYTTLPNTKTGISSVQSSASRIQALLKSNGWTSGSNGVTLSSLIDGTAHGIDYSPDAFYQKIIGNTNCTFDTMIAYSNPQPPAIRSTFICDRTVNVLGSPSGEIYNSSKGYI